VKIGENLPHNAVAQSASERAQIREKIFPKRSCVGNLSYV
jgi:hypothetical protein